MDQTFKTEWVKALRSGEYKQGHGALRRSNDTWCCLGVLCDVYDKMFPGKLNRTNTGSLGESFDGNDGSLPAALCAAADIGPCGSYGLGDLIADNDQHNKNFRQIADIIEKHL
jgi:hypothetical protein